MPEIVLAEEKRFGHTLDIGLRKVEEELKPLADTKRYRSIRGKRPFGLYDTYGLPMDFIVDAARDLGVQFDQSGFEKAMQEQRTRARASWKGGTQRGSESGVCETGGNVQNRAGFLLRDAGKGLPD